MDTQQPEALTQARLKELFDYRDGQLINKTIRRSQIKVGQSLAVLIAGATSRCA